jgi:hypothetical protein
MEIEDKDNKKVIIENPEYATWFTRDQQVLRFLLNSVSPEILTHVTGLDSAAEVWVALKELASSQSRSRIQSLRGSLQNTKKGSLSAGKYVAKKKAIAAELAAAGKTLDKDELIGSILNGLDRSYNSFKTAINANPGTTLADLLNQLVAYDSMQDDTDDTEGFTSSANVARRGGGGGGGDPRPQPRGRADDRGRHDDRPR